MKFLLILGVVLIHCNVMYAYSPENFQENIGIRICSYISEIVCSVCVPCFFIISGFLFFNNVDKFTYKLYIKKIKSRFKTLFIPYIFWCTFCCLLLYIKHRYFHMSGLNIFLDDGNINWFNLVKGYLIIDEAEKFPYAFAFWFIRNLIVFVLLSPLAWLIGKHMILSVSFFIIYIYCDINFYGYEWFVLGSFLAYHTIKPFKFKIYKIIIVSIIFWTTILFRIYNFTNCLNSTITILSGLYLIYYMAMVLNRKYGKSHIFKYMVGSTFIIYSTHQCYCTITRNFCAHICGHSYIIQPILAYMLSFILLVIEGLIIRYFLIKYAYKFYLLITGRR